MKKTLLFLGATALALLAIFVFNQLDQPLPYRLASDTAIRGKGKDGDCMDYALALSSRLAANGIHGRLIYYRWRIRKTGVCGSHVFVLYYLSDGSHWIVDNEISHPKPVSPDTSLLDLVYQLSDNRGKDQVDVELQDGLNHLSFF